jgi:ankyrin repeat protein
VSFNAFEDLCAKCPNLVNRKYEDTTALHQAARAGNMFNLRVLLGWSANPNVIDGQRQTPLHVAMLTGHLEIVKELKRYGASERFSEKFLRFPGEKSFPVRHSEK